MAGSASEASPRHRARLLRVGLGAILLLLVYDGAVRKWLLVEYEQYVFILKDLLLCLIVALTVLTSRALTPRFDFYPPARALFLLYAGLVVVQAFNVNLPNLLLGVWGVKSHLLYAGLALIVAQAYSTPAECLQSLERLYPWIVIPPCLLAFVQLGFPADSFINQQVRGGIEHISYFGADSFVRVTGTFSFSTGMAVFVQSAVIAGAGLVLAGHRGRLLMFGLAVSLAAMPVTGSRGVIVTCIAAILVLLAAGLLGRFASPRLVLRFVGSLVVLGALGFYFQNEAWTALGERTVRTAEDFGDQYRTLTVFTSAFQFMPVAGWFGYGAGATDMGAVALVADGAEYRWLPAGLYFEEENGRVVLELGTIGWLLSLLLRAAFLYWALSLCRRGRDVSIRAAGMIAAPLMAMGFYVGNGVFAPPLGTAHYWLAVGLLGMAQYQQRMLQGGSRRSMPLVIAGYALPGQGDGDDEPDNDFATLQSQAALQDDTREWPRS